MRIKEQKSIPIYVKNKNGVGSNIIMSKITLDFKYVSKEQNKLKQKMKDEIKEKSHWNYTTVIKYAFCFHVC